VVNYILNNTLNLTRCCHISCFIQRGLVCFQRSGVQAVPSCSGTGRSGDDYCTLPAVGQLVLMGDANMPAGAFPLSRCEGDCDTDADCEVRIPLPSFPAVLPNCASFKFILKPSSVLVSLT
jgi:hypothetical protein